MTTEENMEIYRIHMTCVSEIEDPEEFKKSFEKFRKNEKLDTTGFHLIKL